LSAALLLLLLQSARDVALQEVPGAMSGHILVIGVPRSQEALLALLAPLRSRWGYCEV
jgi:hypothetical protein